MHIEEGLYRGRRSSRQLQNRTLPKQLPFLAQPTVATGEATMPFTPARRIQDSLGHAPPACEKRKPTGDEE
jgi:hypothetical protein